MDQDTNVEVEEGGGLCGVSLHEDQVPAVGQQTEIGEESGDEGEEDVVSSLTMREHESCTSVPEGQSEHQEIANGEGVSSWHMYTSGTANSQASMTFDTDVRPDSIQQEEAVTTSSELAAVTVAIHGDADSSQNVDKAMGIAGADDADSAVRVVRQGTVPTLVNYDSSDSDDSSVKTPRIENLEEEGHKFQFPDSNSNTLETGNQKDVNESSAVAGGTEQSGACEQGQELVDGSGNEGYWNSEGYWVDSQGQVWQPQGQDGYWQEQQWNQQTEGQGAYGVNQGQGFNSQGEQWQSQEGVKTEHEQKNVEQTWPSEVREESQGSFEGDNQHQQWAGNDSSLASNQQAQGQYSSHEYYQQQQRYDRSATDSSEQQYYAYYNQDGYASNNSQHQVAAGVSEGGVDTSQSSTFRERTDSDYSETERQHNQGDYSQEGHAQYTYHQARVEGQPDQVQYAQEHQYNQPDPGQSYETRSQQPYDQSQYDQDQSYRHQDQYNQGHMYGPRDQVQQYKEQQAQSYNNSQQYYSQHDHYHQQASGQYNQHGQQQERQLHSSYNHVNQQSFNQSGWSDQQQSGEYQAGRSSQHLSQHSEYHPGGPSGGWQDGGGNDGSHYQYSEPAPQQQSASGNQMWRQPVPDQQQQYYDQQCGSQRRYSAQPPQTSGYHNQMPIPSSTYPPNVSHPTFPVPQPPPSLPVPPSSNLPPPVPPHPPPHIPPPPSHLPLPPPPPPPPPTPPPPLPPSHPPHSLPPPPQSPSAQYQCSGNYSHTSSPQSSWQHSSDPSYHTDPHWNKWKYRKREASQSHGSNHGPPGIPSSPANSVSSDVSSTSRDSPTPVHVSPSVQRSPVVVGSPNHSEHKRSSKPLFSQQLRDPRRSSPPSRTPRDDKYNSTTSSLVHKRKVPPKSERVSSSSSAGPSGIEPRCTKAEKSGKDSKSRVSPGEPVSFPKSSLSGFRIPKHNKSSEQSKSPTRLGDSQVSAMKTASPSRKNYTQTHTPSRNEAAVVDVHSEVKMEQSFNTQTTMSDFNSNATTKSQEHLSSAPAQELDVSAQPVVEVEESATTIETKSDRTISATQSSGSASDLMSLFKSIDNNTLHALASTIQLALNSSTSQHVHVPVDNSKVPSPSPTTTVDKTADSQPTTPAETVKKKETSAMASNVVFTSPKTTAQEQPNDGEPPAIVPTGSSSTDFQTIDEAVNADQGVLPQTKAPPLPVTEVEANSKSLGVGAPRLVIATVLATRVGTSSVSDAAETNQTKADGALTVCIPISKEVKFQVKNPKVEKEVEEKGADVTCDSSREKQNKSSTGQDETKDETSEVPTVKSPHLSLLSAQELMFDPKYMYKEYNLRRVRRPESSPEQSSPQKKQKLEELLTAKESPGDTGTDRVESVINKEGTEEDTREKSQKRKRGRPLLASSGEPPTEPKKRRDDSAPAEAVVTAVVSSDSSVAEEIKSKSDVNKCHTIRRSKLSLSIPHIRHVSSSPPPVTLTQLLSVPKAAEKVPTIAKEVKEDATLEHLTRDKVDKKAVKHTPKLPPRVGSLHETRSQLLCSLCKQKGGVLNLGFLFGPYRYQPEVECNDDTVTNANTTSSSGGVEVWLHEDCCVWAPGVCLVGRQLQGLREALTDASKMVCTVCKKHGATLWCATRSCKSIYHFPCAVEKGCILNEEQFQTLCPKHKETTHVQD